MVLRREHLMAYATSACYAFIKRLMFAVGDCTFDKMGTSTVNYRATSERQFCCRGLGKRGEFMRERGLYNTKVQGRKATHAQ